jgi:hypothetical protein
VYIVGEVYRGEEVLYYILVFKERTNPSILFVGFFLILIQKSEWRFWLQRQEVCVLFRRISIASKCSGNTQTHNV